MGDSELLCGCWEPNAGPLQEQKVLLTTKSPLQPHVKVYLKRQ